MIATTTQSKWCDVLLDLARGHTVDGDRLLSLPGFQSDSKPRRCGRYNVTDQQGMEVLFTASRLVSENVDGFDWIDTALELQERICEPIALREPLSAELAWVTWQLGAAADFAAGLRSVGG